ncbi:hypothetical protein AVEN_121215-1 [Araneus ventricosus]|uniref:Uncharacterized protein n=1 Tax=Araneus ventricosus TaxID=182803 RepID=A0A4Y2MFD7_ARAVE|nr:hypothetical protein AVEN_121215-1 [Araneus ventricosus]
MLYLEQYNFGWRPRWPSGKASALRPDGSKFETRFHWRFIVYWACCTLNHTQGSQTSFRWCGAEGLREGIPAQVWSSSSDRGSKLRVFPQIALVLLQNGAFL